MSELRSGFANEIDAQSDNGNMANACHRYGIVWGCDEECPVLNDGDCEHWKNVEEYLEWEWEQDRKNKKC